MRELKTIILLAALLLVPAGVFAAPASGPATKELTKAEKLFNEGKDALFRGDYTAAIDVLRKAVTEDPKKTSYRVHLARALQYGQKPDEAKAILTDILKQTPDHVEAGQLLGEIYFKADDFKAVAALLEPMLKYRHDYPTYHLLAESKYALGDMDGARKYFLEAVKLNPQSAADHYQLGNIYLASNLFALAADSYQQALTLGLKSPVLHYKLASAYFNLRNYFGNISVVTVKAGQPGTISGDWYLIESIPGQKETFRVAPAASAIYQVAKAMADGIEQRPDIQLLRAQIYLNANRFEQANVMFKDLEKIVPKEDKALFYYYYSQSAFGIGQYEDYLRLLQEAIKLDKAGYESTLVDAYLKVAEQYNQAGDLDKYIQYLTKAVAESPQTASLHLKLGYAYEEAGKFAEAMVQWNMVMDLEPDHPKKLELHNLIVKYTKTPTTKP